LNEAALANLAAWVPALDLYNCRPRAGGGYEAVATWRESTTKRDKRVRNRNLKIMPNGIRDFGVDQGYTALDLVMAACECDLEAAFAFLDEHLEWSGGEPLLDISGLAGSTPKLEMLGLEEPDGNPNGNSNGNGVGDNTSAFGGTHTGASNGASNGAHTNGAHNGSQAGSQASAQITPFKPEAPPLIPPWRSFRESASDAGKAGSESSTGTPSSDPLLESLTYVPGLVGEITDHIVNSARRPNRIFALGAAISVVGTLPGRRARGPTKSATHLNVVNIGPSGSGKGHPLNCILPLLEAAGAGQHVHLGDFSAQKVFNKRLIDMPLTIAVIDEFAGFLSRIVSPKSGAWERQLVKQLNLLWSAIFTPYGTTSMSGEPSVQIKSPAFSLFGAATSEEFWQVLQGAEVSNGFFSRFLVFENATQVPERDPLISDDVPAGLKARLAELYAFNTAPFNMAELINFQICPEPQDIPRANAEVREIYYRLSKWADHEIANDASRQGYLQRIAETAMRLATIRAVGIAGHRAKIDIADMTWGADLASILITRMMAKSQDSWPENSRSQAAEKLDSLIIRRGSMSVREIQQYVRSRYNSREIVDILNQSIVAGRIVKLPDGSYAAPAKPTTKK
jgi:hypothetical protein